MLLPLPTIVAVLAGVVALATTADQASAQSADTGPLQLETKIPLGDVRGRIDHMAVDLKRQRLFVAELGNDSVGIVDLANRKLIRSIPGLEEPQGVGYEPSTDMLYVANAGNGSVRLFEGSDYKDVGRIELGSDADNVRVDVGANRVFVGYGEGALAVLDPSTGSKIGDISLTVHPEGFQIDPDQGRIFVNLPDAHAVAVVDVASRTQIATWPLDRSGNFPMAVDRIRGQLLLVFRGSSELGVFSMTDGKSVSTTETCGDADDLFIDAKRGRIYVSCGEGFLDVFETNGTAYRRTARIHGGSCERTATTTCVHRKAKPGRSGDEVRQGSDLR
jgi:YVTN family beta-propeller protein